MKTFDLGNIYAWIKDNPIIETQLDEPGDITINLTTNMTRKQIKRKIGNKIFKAKKREEARKKNETI